MATLSNNRRTLGEKGGNMFEIAISCIYCNKVFTVEFEDEEELEYFVKNHSNHYCSIRCQREEKEQYKLEQSGFND